MVAKRIGVWAAVAGALTVSPAFCDERLIERYEVGVHGGRGSLVVERVEYEARCGVNPKEHLKVGGPDPKIGIDRYGIDWSAIEPAPVKPPMLHPPTYTAEKFRLAYNGEQVGEIPGAMFTDANSGFTRVLPYVVRKVIAVGEATLVISVESVEEAGATTSGTLLVIGNSDRVYIARRAEDGSWAIEESVMESDKSRENIKDAN